MSYQVLARKYRPKNFTEVVGQQHVLNSLIHALDQNRLHHAYLFTGTRGVGKTSLARLLAKSVNCLNGVSSQPCGQCEHCLAIEQGRFVDLIEIDAASRTRVEDTRDILDNVQYMPSQGKYKIYLIDEVHMLSQHSFNALLKTLEEPPEHVKFLLATTDPHKLPMTILSRCLQFNLKHISETQIEQKLTEILKHEDIGFESGALRIIAHAADGSMRDALSLTDQSIAYSQGQILTQDVQTMLGVVDKEMIDTLMIHILEENSQAMVDFSQTIILAGKSPQSVLNTLAESFYYASLLSFDTQNSQVLPCSLETLQAIHQNYSLDTLQLYYQLIIKAKEDLHLAPNAQCGLGMALLRLCAFSLDLMPASSQNTRNLNAQASTKPMPPSNKKPDLSALKTALASSQNTSAQHNSIKPTKKTIVAKSNVDLSPQLESKNAASAHTADVGLIQPANEVAIAIKSVDEDIDQTAKPTTLKEVPNKITNKETIDWYHLSQSLGLKGTALQIVLNSNLIEHTQNLYTLHCAQAIKTLITENAIKKIEEALSIRQGQSIKVAFSHLNMNAATSAKVENKTKKPESRPNTDITPAEIVEKVEKKEPEIQVAASVDLSVTPAQVIQKQKSRKIDEIYQSLQTNTDIQALAEMGFRLLKENIKLKS